LMGRGESGCRPAGRHIPWFDRFSKCVCDENIEVLNALIPIEFKHQCRFERTDEA